MSIKISWLCPKPVKKHLQALVAFSEAVAEESARSLGMDMVEIRALPHKTTKRSNAWTPIQNHLTLNWYRLRDDGTYEKKKHGELFVDESNSRLLLPSEIDSNTKKLNATAEDVDGNPHTWEA